ncbi:hypothetical protein RHMOL_Rhmol04G0306900 [Rhododendron molle]|uniref:Uncharacterized protein n=1 Tax=Rhododendron molle TaxID=49168 RepID=A0ACC0P8H5_RHOML|nr:hypothetical protein RHMOL_Rhmol04G0306900 [Rhododendron molle]
MVSALCKRGMAKEVEELLEVMEERGVGPDASKILLGHQRLEYYAVSMEYRHLARGQLPVSEASHTPALPGHSPDNCSTFKVSDNVRIPPPARLAEAFFLSCRGRRPYRLGGRSGGGRAAGKGIGSETETTKERERQKGRGVVVEWWRQGQRFWRWWGAWLGFELSTMVSLSSASKETIWANGQLTLLIVVMAAWWWWRQRRSGGDGGGGDGVVVIMVVV